MTVFAMLTVTVHDWGAPATGMHPIHESNVELPSGVAVSVTVVYVYVFAGFAIAAVHPSVDPVVHAIPSPVTLPAPTPLVSTVRMNAAGSNLAVTDLAELTMVVHDSGAPATGVQPLQPLNTDPAAAVAVSVTVV